MNELMKKSLDSMSSVDTANLSTIDARQHEQLDFRSNFMQSRVEDVDRCVQIVTDVISAHAFAMERGLKEEDLMFKRSSLTPQVCVKERKSFVFDGL